MFQTVYRRIDTRSEPDGPSHNLLGDKFMELFISLYFKPSLPDPANGATEDMLALLDPTAHLFRVQVCMRVKIFTGVASQ